MDNSLYLNIHSDKDVNKKYMNLAELVDLSVRDEDPLVILLSKVF